VHVLHVIAPSRRLIVTPDLGLEGVIEDDEETRRRVVRRRAAVWGLRPPAGVPGVVGLGRVCLS
jgi:hypothetical protein